MNSVTGLYIRGCALTTKENFNSIQGLKQWNDSRERVELTAGQITKWSDQSAAGNDLASDRVSRRVSLEKNLWVFNSNSDKFLTSGSDYSFLHNGSKFGIYIIQKSEWSLSAPSTTPGALTTSGSLGTGLQMMVGTDISSGRFAITNRGGSSSVTFQLSNLLNPSSPNFSPSGGIYIQSLTNFGQTLGMKMRYGNAVLNTPPFFSNIANYPSANHTAFQVCIASAAIPYRLGLLIVYDWTEFSDSEVVEFDTKVMALLNEEKLVFQYLDSLP